MTTLLDLLKQAAEQKQRAFDVSFEHAPQSDDVELMAAHVTGLLKAAITLSMFASGGRITESEWRLICTATWAGDHADALSIYASVLAQAKAPTA